MTFTQLAKVTGYERLFQVEGRATREEMWNWCLFLICLSVIMIVISFVATGIGVGLMALFFMNSAALAFVITAIGMLLMFFNMFFLSVFGVLLGIATVTLTIRRLHDTNRSAWYGLLGLIPVIGGLILFGLCFVLKGTQGENKYGVEATY